MLPESSNKSLLEFDSRHVTRADLPFATIGVFRIHPSISHGAAREDLQNEIMPLVTLYQCDAITGDANKSANTYSRLQHVFNPANGLMNTVMNAYQRLWNETENLPLVDRMEYAMETSCALKSIVRHHLYMKTGSGYDRTLPDVMMTFVFGWGKTNIQQVFRKEEMNVMKDEQLEAMRNDPTSAIKAFSRKHGEGFFRWVHLSCSHESHYKVSLQGIIIMKVIARSHCKVIARSHCKESLSHCKESLQGVIARSHCKESLQGVIARSHCKESLQGVIARSHCKESLLGVIARSHCKESLQRVIARSHCKGSLQGVIARSHCKESLQGVIARSHCKESLQGVIARSHESHCELRMEPSASCRCKESSASCKCKESGASCKCMESSASCKRKESSASCKCKESSAIDLRGVKISC